MPGRRGNEAQSDVEPEAHESRSRAKKGEDGTYVGATGPTTLYRCRRNRRRSAQPRTGLTPGARLTRGSRLPENADRRLQLGGGLVCDVLQRPLLACHLDHELGIHRLDQNRVTFAGGVGPHHHVARQ